MDSNSWYRYGVCGGVCQRDLAPNRRLHIRGISLLRSDRRQGHFGLSGALMILA
jgi:hypothetical protein